MKNPLSILKKDIFYEVERIEATIAELKIAKSALKDKEPSNIQKGGFATYLMNFYNGIENILKRVAKTYYGKMPKGSNWHKDLLKQSYNPASDKISVLSQETAKRIFDYLNFRHLYIHGYWFSLKWDKMVLLIDDTDELWMDIKDAIELFFNKLEV